MNKRKVPNDTLHSWLDRENSLNQQRSSLKEHKNQALLHHHQSRRKDQTYTKRHRQKLLQGSLENVSSHPLGEHKPPESTLRRSRSLAISREDIFTNLEIPNPGRSRRRSQLIPRAKLIDRCNNNSSRNSLHRGLSHESLYTDQSTLSVLTRGLEYAVPQQHPGFKYREDISASQYLPTISTLQSTTELDSLEHDAASYKPQPQQGHSNRQHTEDSGLSLPNYYPDSKCDTDVSFTDNISVGNFTRDSKYRQSSLYPESANISYDENIVLSKSQLYDKVEEHYMQSKPRTIRGNTPYYSQEAESYVKPRSLPNFSSGAANGYESDSTLSDYDPKYYEPIEQIGPDSSEKRHDATTATVIVVEEPIVQELQPEKCESLYHAGQPQAPHSNHYHQPQQLQRNDHHLYDGNESKSEFSNIETNPIYDEIPVSAADKELNKTSIQVPCEESLPVDEEEFKTVVRVPEQKSQTSDEEDVKEAKKHSHNYLKEFLETQKGSKKPLQNFLSKRISRAFNSNDGVTKPKKSNLTENQFFSLPDITVSKNLQKCEKIDRKLRKCEKLTKSPSDVSTNRFIVNIGNHFDVTASSSIPVDFELKISKIPKAKKSAKGDKTFVDAVKSMNETITKGEINPKVIVNGEEINTKDFYQRDKEVEVIIEDTKITNKANMNKEFQEKINTMRNYWGSMVVKDTKEFPQEEEKEPPPPPKETKCKIVGMQTKIEEVKKKFEPKPEETKKEEERPPSKVQMTKQFFENNDAQLQKASSKQGLLENPYFDNHFESLNPNTVELIEPEKQDNQISTLTKVTKPKKEETTKDKDLYVKKTKSVEPEFDHVRYRVVKSDLFQKKIFAKCDKESQFDGLMQYLQDYSFQELLIDNNIVIIEPIRTNIQYVGSTNSHPNKVTKFIRTPGKPPANNETSGLRKHFFYHPIRVNREVNDDELPTPDTVKQVRQLFEGQMPRSQSSKNLDSLTKQTVQYIRPVDPDKDRCSASDGSSNISECDEELENDVCCEYVSEDILEKIRECGTTVTYYGGRMTSKRKPPAMTKAIMDEIQNQKCTCNCRCKSNNPPPTKQHHNNPTPESTYQGVKFKLLKSNSCSSRLELVGTKNLSEYRNKFINKQKQILDDHHNQKNGYAKSVVEKNNINESIREIDCNHMKHEHEKGLNNGSNTLNDNNDKCNNIVTNNHHNSMENSPKIIAEEMKTKRLIQWGEMRDDNKTYSGITYTHNTHNAKTQPKICYDFYEKVKPKPKREDMEFEPYEIAN